MKTLVAILTATELEQKPLRDRLGDSFAGRDLSWHIGGMGAGATAAATLCLVRDLRPGIVIQAGIAGALPRKRLAVGDTVLIGSDYQADLGAWRPETGKFEPFSALPEASATVCPYAEPFREHFRIVGARSANSACSPLPLRGGEALESMEGAAFFSVCRAEKVPFLQVRSVSNRVGDPRGEWRIPEALEALSEALARLLETLPVYNL
ncbi:hypothetical protein [Rikenella microfusus]|uniref:Futalosine nucleosidase n=1 Tax=Rikenella microfusus TaxID=28139 RepID=A0A379MSU2_9BACT|nr:hypothetical protein [Rikenella microfusus]SUE34603.1 futalosine nucleosidase [Rikenella microfusus]